MQISIVNKVGKSDLLVIPLYSGKKESENFEQPSDFEGNPNETVMLYQKDKITPRIVLIGLGKEQDEKAETWRQAGAKITAHLKKNIKHMVLVAPKEDIKWILAFLEGLLLAHYKYEQFLSQPADQLSKIEHIQIVIQKQNLKSKLEEALKELVHTTETVKWVRDIVNAPSNVMNPSTLSQEAERIAKKSRKIKCKIFDEKKLKKMGMGCLVGVGQGAHEKSKLIFMEYKNKPTHKKPIVLIGKGICFDAGGINLKLKDLETMKYDMTGAAIVLGIFELLSRLPLPLHVIGIAACAENLVGGNVTKPGDILTAYDGTTVEITNTDAEGRLVLCDAIGYAVKEHHPELVIDVATLTSAAIVALGYSITALLTNHERYGEKIKRAAHEVDEKIWELPLEEEYKKEIKSSIADLKNHSPEVAAGTIMGGLFLEHFIKGTPWIHIDLGGSAWSKTSKTYYPQGATGRGVRTLWQFLKNSVTNQ